jgi:hypothetical protein
MLKGIAPVSRMGRRYGVDRCTRYRVGRECRRDDDAEDGDGDNDEDETRAMKSTKYRADTGSQCRRESPPHHAYPLKGDALPPPMKNKFWSIYQQRRHSAKIDFYLTYETRPVRDSATKERRYAWKRHVSQ